ncbi:MAG: hypothetical protein ACR2N7_11520, partial [Acidimicrobiia bacterium]
VVLIELAMVGVGDVTTRALLLIPAIGLVAVASLATKVARFDGRWIFNRALVVGLVVGIGVYGSTLANALQPDAIGDHLLVAVLVLLVGGAGFAAALRPHNNRAWYAMLGFWTLGVTTMLIATSRSGLFVDSLMFQEVAIDALLQGMNPFTLTYIDIYEPAVSAMVYGQGVSVDGMLQFGYPYMPLSLLVATPFDVVLGDIRFVFGLAVLAAGIMMSRLGHVPIARPVAVAFLLAVPHLKLVRFGWVDGLVVAGAVGWLLVTMHSSRLSSYASGVVFALKQYSAVLVVPSLLAMERPWRVRDVAAHFARAALVFAVFTVPFAAWDFPSFYRSVVELQFLQPFRPDSLSIPALLGDSYAEAPAWSTTLLLVVVVVVASVLVALRTPTGVQGMALASGFVLLVTFAFSKQAFGNYYSVAMAFLCAAAATAEPVAEPAEASEYASTA